MRAERVGIDQLVGPEDLPYLSVIVGRMQRSLQGQAVPLCTLEWRAQPESFGWRVEAVGERDLLADVLNDRISIPATPPTPTEEAGTP